VADGVRVAVMELKPVIVKKAAEERTRGEGQSPFGKMVKCDDFVNIFHGKKFTERGAPVDKVFSCSNPSETSLFRSLREHLLYVHSPVDSCASFFFPSISDFLGAISGSTGHETLEGCGERGGEIGVGDFFGRMTAARGSVWGFLWLLARCRLEAQFFLTVAAGLNNQWLGKSLLF
jgi:hypothetical protein